MWKKFKWDMFVTSFIPLWISIIVIDFWDFVSILANKWDSKIKLIDNIKSAICESYIQLISIIIIVFLVLFSIKGVNSFLKGKVNADKNQPKGTIVKATKANKLSSEFLLAYILPMIAFDFGDIQKIVLFLIYFSVLAFLCIRNNNIYTNIWLEFKGYHIYTCDFKRKIIKKEYTFYDSIIISKTDLTQEENNEVPYWDFENHIYIVAEGDEKQ